MHRLIENADQVFCFDNERLNDICSRTLKISGPSFGDVNHLIAMVMNGTTCSMRFPGQLNLDLRQLSTSLVPFGRKHFFVCGYAPLASIEGQQNQSLTVNELTDQLFDPLNVMASVDTSKFRYLTAACLFRGEMSTSEVEERLSYLQTQNANNYVRWIPNNVMCSYTDVPPKKLNIAATFVGNNTGVRGKFESIIFQIKKMYDRRSYIHWYANEGMENVEIDEAIANMEDLVTEYNMYENLRVGDEEKEEEDGDDN